MAVDLGVRFLFCVEFRFCGTSKLPVACSAINCAGDVERIASDEACHGYKCQRSLSLFKPVLNSVTRYARLLLLHIIQASAWPSGEPTTSLSM
jgi:hypothetical protein